MKKKKPEYDTACTGCYITEALYAGKVVCLAVGSEKFADRQNQRKSGAVCIPGKFQEGSSMTCYKMGAPPV